MNLESYIDALAERAEASLGAPEQTGDYRQDGLVFCGKCRTAKQCRVRIDGAERIVRCQCGCEAERDKAERDAVRERQRECNARILRETGITDKSLRGCTFDGAEMTPELRMCKRYVERWDEMRQKNTGLLLWGNTGNGKTFAAACIANALIERGLSAVITSIPRILMTSFDEQEDAIDRMRRCSLLVIDDLGAERSSDYALETVYTVIDERYKAKKPLIITTNLTLQQICQPPDMRYQRIYDRVLECCVPVRFSGESIRRKRAKENLAWAKRILAGEGEHEGVQQA